MGLLYFYRYSHTSGGRNISSCHPILNVYSEVNRGT